MECTAKLSVPILVPFLDRTISATGSAAKE
jgi:hypothetical protein